MADVRPVDGENAGHHEADSQGDDKGRESSNPAQIDDGENEQGCHSDEQFGAIQQTQPIEPRMASPR